jgi:hypothetical protein
VVEPTVGLKSVHAVVPTMSTSVDDETILEVLRENDDPRMTTTEVAEELPITRGTTRSRLQRLVDDDRVERTREGNSVVWWLPARTGEMESDTADADGPEPDDAAERDDVAGNEAAEPEPDGTPADAGEQAAADGNAAEGADESDADGDDADADDGATEIEVTATSDPEPAHDEPTAVEVEAVGDDSEPAPPYGETVTEEDEQEPDLPDLSDDEEGLRALAALAVGLVLVLLIRRLFAGGDES